MKYVCYLITFSFVFIGNLLFAQNAKHLWQLPRQQPYIAFNQNGQMSVFTYDRLSIYNVESGALEKSYDFLANRSPYVWPTTARGEYSEDFKFYRLYGQNKDLSGNRGQPVRLDLEKEKWEVIPKDTYKYPYENYRSIDIKGRDLVDHLKNKEVWLHKPTGKKTKKIVSDSYIQILLGGRFGIYNDNGQKKLIDFSTDVSTDLDFAGNISILATYPEWVLVKDGANKMLFNPYTNEREMKAIDDKYAEIPTKYVPSKQKFIDWVHFGHQDVVYYGNYRYQIVRDSTIANAPDQYGAVPHLVKQYDITNFNLAKTFAISASKTENDAQAATVAPIYDGVQLMKAKEKKESQARADEDAQYQNELAQQKEAESLAKALLINFKTSGTTDGFSLLGLKGRDITDLPYTKKYLSHIKGQITAIFQFTCGASRILVVGAKVGNDVTFMFVRTTNSGVYKFTKNIANVYNRGNLITENIAIGFTNIGGTIKADVTFMYPATGNKRTTVVYAPCSGDWK